MIRRLSLAVALALGVAPFGVRALGLGDIQLNSALNQYLNADIKLLSANVDELDGIQVTLGSPAAFERAGIDRNYQLSYLTFKPVLLPDGSPVIRVASREPVREPFLNFIVEMNWPKGRLIREYTLLLDPPVTIDRRPPPVATSTLAPKPAIRRPQPTAAAPVVKRAAPVGDSYGPVKRNDTLWAISKRVRHDGATLAQTMMSLLQANPQAFVNQDINRLKAGAILRLPAREEVFALAAGEAAQLYRESIAGKPSKPAVKPAPQPEPVEQIERSPESEPEVGEAAPEAELKIAATDPEAELPAGTAEAPLGEETTEDLQQDLAFAREAEATARLEGEELRSRVADLESQLDDMKRLLELKSEQLASMQGSLSETQAQPPQSEETGAGEKVAAAEQAGETASAAESSVTPVMEETKTPPPPAKSEARGFVEKLMNDTSTMGIAIAAVVVLLSLLWVIISRRRSSSADFQESILVNTVDESEAEPMSRGQRVSREHAGESSFLSDFSASDIDALQDETGEVDPLAEADVYIAYGRYRQAEELIRQAIERDSERDELKIKLFEILSATKDRAAFVALAESASAEGVDKRDMDAWARVLEMGAGLAPDHPLFAGIEASAEEQDLGFDLDLDIDLRNQGVESAVAEAGDRQEKIEPATYDIDESPLAASDAESAYEAPPVVQEESPATEFDELEFPSTASEKKEGASEIDSEMSAFDFEFDATGTEEVSEGKQLEQEESAEGGFDEIPSLAEGVELDADEVNTKLDLARAYVEMGDEEDARDILQEVIAEGDDAQKKEAEEILNGIT